MLSVYDALLIARRHANAMFDELLDAAREPSAEAPMPQDEAVVADVASASAPIEPGDWREVDRQSGVNYRWMDGNVDDYTEFVVYEDGRSGAVMGIGKIAPRDIRGKQRSYRVV